MGVRSKPEKPQRRPVLSILLVLFAVAIARSGESHAAGEAFEDPYAHDFPAAMGLDPMIEAMLQGFFPESPAKAPTHVILSRELDEQLGRLWERTLDSRPAEGSAPSSLRSTLTDGPEVGAFLTWEASRLSLGPVVEGTDTVISFEEAIEAATDHSWPHFVLGRAHTHPGATALAPSHSDVWTSAGESSEVLSLVVSGSKRYLLVRTLEDSLRLGSPDRGPLDHADLALHLGDLLTHEVAGGLADHLGLAYYVGEGPTLERVDTTGWAQRLSEESTIDRVPDDLGAMERLALQAALRVTGHYDGEIVLTGDLGPGLREALERYREDAASHPEWPADLKRLADRSRLYGLVNTWTELGSASFFLVVGPDSTKRDQADSALRHLDGEVEGTAVAVFWLEESQVSVVLEGSWVDGELAQASMTMEEDSGDRWTGRLLREESLFDGQVRESDGSVTYGKFGVRDGGLGKSGPRYRSPGRREDVPRNRRNPRRVGSQMLRPLKPLTILGLVLFLGVPGGQARGEEEEAQPSPAEALAERALADLADQEAEDTSRGSSGRERSAAVTTRSLARLREAARLGSPKANLELAKAYLGKFSDGVTGPPIDRRLALRLFRRALELGEEEAAPYVRKLEEADGGPVGAAPEGDWLLTDRVYSKGTIEGKGHALRIGKVTVDRWLVSWSVHRKNRHLGIHARLVDRDGRPTGPVFKVSGPFRERTPGLRAHRLATTSGRAMVTWQPRTTVFASFWDEASGEFGEPEPLLDDEDAVLQNAAICPSGEFALGGASGSGPAAWVQARSFGRPSEPMALRGLRGGAELALLSLECFGEGRFGVLYAERRGTERYGEEGRLLFDVFGVGGFELDQPKLVSDGELRTPTLIPDGTKGWIAWQEYRWSEFGEELIGLVGREIDLASGGLGPVRSLAALDREWGSAEGGTGPSGRTDLVLIDRLDTGARVRICSWDAGGQAAAPTLVGTQGLPAPALLAVAPVGDGKAVAVWGDEVLFPEDVVLLTSFVDWPLESLEASSRARTQFESALRDFEVAQAGIEAAQEEAIGEIRRLAEAGDRDARTRLVQIYSRGEFGFQYAQEEALRWMKRLAEDGDLGWQYRLALALSNGRITEDGAVLLTFRSDEAEARHWSELAATGGHTEAKLLLGTLLHGGRGGEQSSSEALRWLREAAREGSVQAQHLAGDILRAGTGGRARPRRGQGMADDGLRERR